MSLFSNNRFLGVDFGTESIKVVELEMRNDRPHLVNYGEAVLLSTKGSAENTSHSFQEDMIFRFQAVLERMKPETKNVYISIPSFLGLISLIDFPEMTEQELEDAVKFEAQKYIPSPLEEVALSWESLGSRDILASDGSGSQKHTEVLLVAALNKDVWLYEGYVKAVGYDMKLLELETFSIARAIVGNDPSAFLVIDIGARATNLILVEGGAVKMSRNIDAGGRDITRTIADSINITLDRADDLKKGQKDFLNSREAFIIFPAIEMIINEARRMIKSWKSKHPDARIDEVILSGGSSRMTGLAEYLSTKLGIQTMLGDPWKNIVLPPELKGVADKIDLSFVVAIGLALYGSKKGER